MKSATVTLNARNVKTLSWTVIAKIWDRAAPRSAERRMIIAECRRLGYAPHVILTLNGSVKA
jgi:hypothetical protein